MIGRTDLPPSTGGTITLGYADDFDGYSDNGYWSHDDGIDDQCRGIGPAFVILTITRAGAAGRPDVDLTALEVTQSVQNVDHLVPLVADKMTYVRAYLSDASRGRTSARGVLTTTLPSGATITVLSANALVVPAAGTASRTLRAT